VVETDNDHINQQDQQGNICPSPPSGTFQLQSYIEAGDQNKDQTTGGNILEQDLLLSWVHPSSSSTTTTAIIAPSTSNKDRGQKRRKTNSIGSNQLKRLKDWRKKKDVEIEEKEKIMEETSAEIEEAEVEVRKLNNVLAGRRGKTTFSDCEHTFSQQAEKILMKSEIDSLSVELKNKRTMRTQNKKVYLGFLQNLSARRKEYLKLVQAEKEEVKTVIGLTPFIQFI